MPPRQKQICTKGWKSGASFDAGRAERIIYFFLFIPFIFGSRGDVPSVHFTFRPQSVYLRPTASRWYIRRILSFRHSQTVHFPHSSWEAFRARPRRGSRPKPSARDSPWNEFLARFCDVFARLDANCLSFCQRSANITLNLYRLFSCRDEIGFIFSSPLAGRGESTRN